MTDLSPSIISLSGKTLIGKWAEMSIIENKTAELWGGFMPHHRTVESRIGGDFYSLQVYAEDYFRTFDPNKKFVKWAAVEVSEVKDLPEGMGQFNLEGGQYAVFHYKGLPGDPAIFQYIYTKWLPASDYLLDDRPHFEVLGDNYKANSPESEEEICIPVNIMKKAQNFLYYIAQLITI